MHRAALAAAQPIWTSATFLHCLGELCRWARASADADRSRHHHPTKLAASANVRDTALIHANGIHLQCRISSRKYLRLETFTRCTYIDKLDDDPEPGAQTVGKSRHPPVLRPASPHETGERGRERGTGSTQSQPTSRSRTREPRHRLTRNPVDQFQSQRSPVGSIGGEWR